MRHRRLVFTGPGAVAVEAFDPGPPGPGQVGLTTLVSAVSAGTEALLWSGLWPAGMAVDSLWDPTPRDQPYPLAYGYAAVGRVDTLGPGVDQHWLGRLAFVFGPHQSAFVVDVADLVALPPGLAPEDAVFLASLETALTLAQDAAPVAGEAVGLWGLGTVGLLTGLILGPSFAVKAWDPIELRRTLAARRGLDTGQPASGTCDVALELSGHPEAFDQALAALRFSGRLVVGSWYGARPVSVNLGGEFHRSRIHIVSSQVSSLNPGLSGRWTKARRLAAALDLAATLAPSSLVTHRFALEAAPEAYAQACDQSEKGLQVLFTYS